MAIVSSAIVARGQSVFAGNAASRLPQAALGSLLEITWFPPSGSSPPASPIATLSLQPQGTSVKFVVQLIESVPYEVLGVVPDDIPLGPAYVLLTINGTDYPTGQVTIVPVSLGIFTTFQSGFGPAVAQNVVASRAPQVNQLTRPALPGQYVTLWGTGLGHLSTSDVSISIAGEPIPAAFAGHAPGLPGVDQMNFIVPQDAVLGCYVPVTVSGGGSYSNAVTLSIANASGGCDHPLGLSADDLAGLDEGNEVYAVSISYSAAITAPSAANPTAYARSENFDGEFFYRSAEEIFLLSPKIATSGGSPCGPSLLSAYLASLIGINPSPAGPSIELTSPSGNLSQVPANGLGYYLNVSQTQPVADPSSLPPPFFAPGVWQLSAAGGDIVDAFDLTTRLPPEVHWTNRAAVATVDRSHDLSITWDSTGYGDQDMMNVLAGVPSGRFSGTPTGVSCSVPASAGALFIPSTLLQSIGTGAGTVELFVSSRSPSVFQVPLTAGGTSPAAVSYFFSDTLNVNFQ